MAKKYKSVKLTKQTTAVTQKPASAFGKFATRLADARKRKIQKLTDTQKRLLESKKNNKMIKVSKKAKKFALLDEQNQGGDGNLGLSMTHRGVNIKDLKQFDDVNLGESDLQNDEQFDQIQDKMNFAGFEATDNLLQERRQVDPNKQKTKTEIYKEIIEKSKAYKMLRQEQYEENFNMANELDEGFDKLVSQLKFRNKDQQLLEKLENRDLEYDKLMNELRDDERIVSNKIVEKNEKYTENIRKKKNQQLNKLMKDNGQDADIRGWVDDAAEDEEDQENQSGSGSDEGEDDSAEDQENGEQNQDQEQGEGSYDELDDVNLSSEEEQVQSEEEGEVEGQQENNPQVDANDQSQEPQVLSDQDNEQNGEDDEDKDDEDDEDDEDDDQQEEESEQVPLPTNKRNRRQQNHKQKNTKSHQQNTPKQPAPQSRQAPQKKRKLNFIE